MIKGQLLSEEGAICFSSEYPSPTYLENGISFLSTKESEEIVYRIINELVKRSDEDVSCVCFSSLGESFALLDEDGESINDFILFVSDLGEEECNQVRNKISDEEISQIAGLIPNRMFSFSKLMWIKKNKRELYNSTSKFVMVAQYMVYRLTNTICCDYSLATRTMLFDVKNKKWSKKLIDICDLDSSIFPDLYPADKIIGRVSAEASRKTGLSQNCAVLVSGHDQMMATLGAGVYQNGMANDGTGTAECLTVTFDHIPTDFNFYKNNFCIVPYIIDGLYLTYAFTSTAGALLKWHRNYLSPLEREEIEKDGEDYYSHYSNADINLPTNLLVLPHFDGTGTPYLDSSSSGAILGLSQKTTKEEIYFALMEGSSFEINLCIDLLKKSGINVSSLSVNGGGAKSSSWLKIKANVFNKDIKTLSSPEGGIFGCFLMSMKAITNLSYEKLIKKYVKTKEIIRRDENLVNKYKANFEKYKRIYPAIKNIWR